MKHLILISLLLFPCLAFAQQARVAGLESDTLYMALLADELELQHAEDSLSQLLAGTRSLLRDNPDARASYGQRILSLEAELFDLRSRIGMLSGRINAVEQRFVMDNLLGNTPLRTSTTLQEYLRNHLSAEDHAAWRRAESYEQPVYNFVKTYLANYLNIRDISQGYDTITQQRRADSVFARYSELRRFAGVMSDTIAALWGQVYDTKSYLCNLLMDKANNRIYLGRLQERLMQLEGAKAALIDDSDSPVVSCYVPEKQFVMQSELALSDYAGDGRHADSLRTAVQALEGMMALPVIALERKLFDTIPETPQVDARGRPIKPAAKPVTDTKPVAYRLEIVSRESTLPDTVRDLLGQVEISRAASSDAGGELYTFIAIVAQGQAHTDELAVAIRAAQPTLIVQVNSITN